MIWPEEFFYINESVSDEMHITIIKEFLFTGNEEDRDITHPFLARQKVHPHITLEMIRNESHPCYCQRGVFATQDILPGEAIGEYVGELRLVDHRFKNVAGYTYSMTLRVIGNLLLIVDASRKSNEIPFINDYRGIKEKPNVRAVGAIHKGYLMPLIEAISPIYKGEELLTDYGKGYWTSP